MNKNCRTPQVAFLGQSILPGEILEEIIRESRVSFEFLNDLSSLSKFIKARHMKDLKFDLFIAFFESAEDIDSHEIFSTIKKFSDLKDIPVVIIVKAPTKDFVRWASLNDVSSIIVTPIDRSSLERKINNFICSVNE